LTLLYIIFTSVWGAKREREGNSAKEGHRKR